MGEYKSMLCVGGPRAGQRYEIRQGTGLIVPVAKTTPHRIDQGPPPNVAAVEYFEYRAEIFHTPQGDVSFWTPRDQTPLETITLLLARYEASFQTGAVRTGAS